MKYTIWAQTPEILERMKRLVPLLPAAIPIEEIRLGIPPVYRYPATDANWNGFPMPYEDGVVYVHQETPGLRYQGGAIYRRCSVYAGSGEGDDAVFLRLWHEILHTYQLPADGMKVLAPGWIEHSTDRMLWSVARLLRMNVDTPIWHRAFYSWLTKDIAAGSL